MTDKVNDEMDRDVAENPELYEALADSDDGDDDADGTTQTRDGVGSRTQTSVGVGSRL